MKVKTKKMEISFSKTDFHFEEIAGDIIIFRYYYNHEIIFFTDDNLHIDIDRNRVLSISDNAIELTEGSMVYDERIHCYEYHIQQLRISFIYHDGMWEIEIINC